MCAAMADNDGHHREWLPVQQFLPTLNDDERFLLLSYNVLADVNARSHSADLQLHLPALITNWPSRKQKILQEILALSPDVICLQEVDHFEEFAEELRCSGYVGVYARRTGGCRDGCAVFWKGRKFVLLEDRSIEFRDYKLRDNVAQICVLESKCGDGAEGIRVSETTNFGFKNDNAGEGIRVSATMNLRLQNRLVVGNIHVMFNPQRGEVKLGQARVFLETLHAVSEKWGSPPVAIAGDFNSTPSSPLYSFLTSSHLDLSGLNRQTISGQEDALERSNHTVRVRVRIPESFTSRRKRSAGPPKGWDPFMVMAATGDRHCHTLQHKFKLRSAYSEIEGRPGSRDARGEPLITAFHKSFSGTVDYIWHTDGISVRSVLDMPPVSVLQCEKGLPSQHWASDHLALACEFSFVPSRDTQQASFPYCWKG